jgi:hypothetical protein
MSSFPKCNILVAYPCVKPDLMRFLQEHEGQINWLLDSGAFTAWKKKEVIQLDDYCKFVEGLPITPWRYFTLDVVGDPHKTRENYFAMRQRGFKPVPIFTRGEDIQQLEEYYSTHDVIGIGGLVGTKGNRSFVRWIMENGVKSRKVHLLGFGQPDFLAFYKPYSCDSSGWAGAVRYATLQLYRGQGRWIRLGKKDFVNRPKAEVFEIFESYGEDIREAGKASEWTNSGRGDRMLERLTCKAWARWAIDLERIHNVKFFLACACTWQIRQLLEAHDFWKAKITNTKTP